MNETLEKKQIELLRTLKERFRERPRSCWQSETKKYKTTWEVGNTYDDYPEPSEETIIRYNLKAAIFTIAALLLYMVVLLTAAQNEGIAFNYIMSFILGVVVVTELKRVLDRTPKIIINSQSIWFKKIDLEVEWKDLMASYIEEDHSGDSVTSSLILFHYDQYENAIIETTIKLNESLEMNDVQLCYYIEYWKIKTGNRTPTV